MDASDNSLSALDVNNNTCLTYLDFSCNNIQNINLLNNSQLEYLYCNDCNLLSLNISNLNRLIEVNCENNEISELRTNNNLSLKELHCCLNYLDIQDTSTQMNNFNIMINNSSCNISYFPQKTPPNANFDSDEISYLKNLAINNTSLNWISDNKELNIESIQKNVLFEKINNKYRVTLIDISNIDISENLNLNSFAYLKELYCDNSNICGLNLYNCTSLEVISCKNCNILTFILPSNKDNSNLYYLDCEFNHINTASITETIINNIKSKENSVIDYKRQKADLSAYQAALDFIGKLVKSDYSIESFSDLSAQIALCNDYNLDYLTQSEADQITSNLLTEIYNLKAFLNAKISAKNGIVKVFYDETELEDSSLTNSGGVIELPPDTEGFTVSDGSDTFSVLFGTTVTLTATPKEGYNFVGWFDSSSNRHISTENPYTFRVAANVDIKAIFASDGNATLTFLTPSNQVITTISKFPAEWAEINTINGLVPDVPFKYGCKNGRWEYNEADVLSKLRSGENVNIVSAYDKGEFTVPSPKKAEDKPALDLYYNYDDESGIGSFIMTTGFPENIKVESVGIAYYFKAADSFNPKDYILTLNNKVRTSKFGMDKLYDYYIMNMKNINDRNNWSVRGYVAYYDSNDNLQVEYSNQINIINNIVDRSTVSNDNSATQLPPDEI
ncbi:InlB B-repeat-containing protein [Eubacterium sp.]